MVMNSRRFLPSMHPHETQAESADTSPGTPGPQFALIVQNLSGLQGPWAFLLVLSWDGADLGLQREGTAQGSVPRVAWDKQKMQLGLHQHWVESNRISRETAVVCIDSPRTSAARPWSIARGFDSFLKDSDVSLSGQRLRNWKVAETGAGSPSLA